MSRVERTRGSSLFWGMALIGLGVLFLLQRLGIVEHHLLHRFWPLLIVMAGISNLFCARTVWRGVWVIAAGCWLQAIALGVFGLTFSNSWPLLLIAAGASMVLRTFFDVGSRRRREQEFATRMEDRHEP